MGFKVTVTTCLLGLFFLSEGVAQAKELTNRLGVGFAESFTEESLPGLAVRYYPSAHLGLSGSLGVDTKKDSSRFGFIANIHRVIFMEDNLNFYTGAGVGVLSVETDGKNESGFEVSSFFGAEFFFYGLDSLAFIFEAGIRLSSFSSEVRFRTLGTHPIRGGIIFYF